MIAILCPSSFHNAQNMPAMTFHPQKFVSLSIKKQLIKKHTMKKISRTILSIIVMIAIAMPAKAAESFVSFSSEKGFIWIQDGKALPILIDKNDFKGVLRAANDLKQDANQVTGTTPDIIHQPSGKRAVIVGSISQSQWIKQLIAQKKLDGTELQGKQEKFIIQTIANPFEGMDEAVVIAGSDKRGTIYGIYELCEQMGVCIYRSIEQMFGLV